MLASLFRWLRDVVTGASRERRLVILRLLAIKPVRAQQIVLECAAMAECDTVHGVLQTLARMERDGYVASEECPGTAESGWRPRSRYWITEAGRALLAASGEATDAR